MRQETIVLVDDIDGSEPAKKVSFGLDGVDYEIDLCEANEDRLRKVFEDIISVARKQPKVKKPRITTSRKKAATPTEK
jgi:hypothetical protein